MGGTGLHWGWRMPETWECMGARLGAETLGTQGHPELQWCPGQAARRKAVLMQLHERQNLPSTGRLLPP